MPPARPLSTTTCEGYDLVEIRVEEPIPSFRVPENRSGVAFILRHGSFPLGFFMQARPPASMITGSEIAARIVRDFGTAILREHLESELSALRATPPVKFPSLDFAICTRNRPKQLNRCLKSLRGMQEGTDYVPGRILVVDNAPANDETERLVGMFPEVSYYREPLPGLDFARNRALVESSAELIAFLDDDAALDRSWLAGLQHGWQTNPDAAAFTGPVFPLELETPAQVLFEQMGGFGGSLVMARFGSEIPDSDRYPYNAGILGTGCNMVFRRRLLLDLGGFDEALDTGEPLPGGGDIDMFYRVIRAGHTIVREPKMVVYHQPRQTHADLRHQMQTWGLSVMAFMTKCHHNEPANRPIIRRWIIWWFRYSLNRTAFVYHGEPDRRPADLALSELCGAVVGLLGEYRRSQKRVAERQALCLEGRQQRSLPSS